MKNCQTVSNACKDCNAKVQEFSSSTLTIGPGLLKWIFDRIGAVFTTAVNPPLEYQQYSTSTSSCWLPQQENILRKAPGSFQMRNCHAASFTSPCTAPASREAKMVRTARPADRKVRNDQCIARRAADRLPRSAPARTSVVGYFPI